MWKMFKIILQLHLLQANIHKHESSEKKKKIYFIYKEKGKKLLPDRKTNDQKRHAHGMSCLHK